MQKTTVLKLNFYNYKKIPKLETLEHLIKGLIQIESDSRKKISVGRMVALTFLTESGIDYTKRKVKHVDGNINNNRVDNLIWM